LLPTTMINAPLWGQTDVIYTTFLLAFFYNVLKQRPLLAIVAFGVAVSFKAQALFLAPYLLFLVLRREIRWAYLAIVPAIYVLSVLPAAFAGRSMADLLTIYLAQAGTYERLSMSAPNLYPFVQRYLPVSFGVAVGLGLALATVVGCFLAASAWQFRAMTNELHLFMATLMVALMPFLLPKMHDRFFFPADVFSYLLAFAEPPLWPAAVGFQLSSSLACSHFLFGFHLGPALGGLINLILLTILLIWLWRADWSLPRGTPVAHSAAL
jgi:Gpi18-like mannosyltransferase